MGSLRRKSAFVLTCALLASSEGCFAANNDIYGVVLDERGNNIFVDVVARQAISDTIKPVKSGAFYNLIVPNSTAQSNARCISSPSVDSCRISTVPTSDGSSYTKIQIKTSPEAILKVISSTNLIKLKTDEPAMPVKDEREILDALNNSQEEEFDSSFEEPSFEAPEEELNFEEEEIVEEPIVTPEPTPTVVEQPSTPALTTTVKPAPKKQQRNHTEELLYISIGALVVILASALICYGARDKIQQQMGDLDIDISDTKKKKPKEDTAKDNSKTKTKKSSQTTKTSTAKKAQPKPRYEAIDLGYSQESYSAPQVEESPFPINDEPYIDIDSLYVKQEPRTYAPQSSVQVDIVPEAYEEAPSYEPEIVLQTTPEPAVGESSDDDLDDFLSAFADKEEEDNEEISVTGSQEYTSEPEKESLQVDFEPERNDTSEETNTEASEPSPEDALSDSNELPEFEFSNNEDQEPQSEIGENYEQSNNEEGEEAILSVEDLLGENESNKKSTFDNSDIEDDDISSLLNNPLDNLMDDMLATEGLEFTDADVEFIQKQLQVDITPELLDEFRLASQTLPQEPLMTLEKFDEENPKLSDTTIDSLLKEGITFNSVDTQVIHSIMSTFEVSEESITDARIRKEQEDKANIDFYQNEAEFAFTLVKSNENSNEEFTVLDENYYPELENVDFSNDAILSEFNLIPPEKPNYTEELDLSQHLTLEDLLGETEPIAQENTYETSFQDNIDDNFVELDETSTEVSSFIDEIDTAQTMSMEEVEAQFKALGLDLSNNTPKEEKEEKQQEQEQVSIEAPSEIQIVSSDTDTVQDIEAFINAQDTIPENTIPESATSESSILDSSSDNAEVFAKYAIDDSTKLYITKYEGKNILVGMKNDIVKPLYEFPDEIPATTISARISETLENKTRYIVRVNKFKSVVEVSEDDIEMVLVL